MVEIIGMKPAGAEAGSPPPGPCPAGKELVVVSGCVKWDVGSPAWVAAGPKDLECMGEAANSAAADVAVLMNSFGVPTYVKKGTSATEALSVTVVLPEDSQVQDAAMAYKAARMNCITENITVEGRVITFSAGPKYGISNVKLCISAVICK